jgi:hypothetical protein
VIEWRDADRPFAFDPARPDLPDVRHARLGTRDEGHDALGRKVHMRLFLTALEGNPREDGRQRWPIVDSLGRPMCILERHSNRWDVHHPETNELIYRDTTLDEEQLELQGQACMQDEALERTHALLKFRANDDSGLPAAEKSTIPFAFAGFIRREAIPDRRGKGRADIQEYATGCGGSRLPVRATGPVGSPDFDSNKEKFVGGDGRARTLATYNAKRPYLGARYIMVNTTGVSGGGVIRAVIRAEDLFEHLDEFGYPDPNVAAGTPGLVRWVYGRIAGTRICGWLPQRAQQQVPPLEVAVSGSPAQATEVTASRPPDPEPPVDASDAEASATGSPPAPPSIEVPERATSDRVESPVSAVVAREAPAAPTLDERVARLDAENDQVNAALGARHAALARELDRERTTLAAIEQALGGAHDPGPSPGSAPSPASAPPPGSPSPPGSPPPPDLAPQINGRQELVIANQPRTEGGSPPVTAPSGDALVDELQRLDTQSDELRRAVARQEAELAAQLAEARERRAQAESALWGTLSAEEIIARVAPLLVERNAVTEALRTRGHLAAEVPAATNRAEDAPRRVLTPSEPYPKGPDVGALQVAINVIRSELGQGPVEPDGEYGPITHDAAIEAAWYLGIGERRSGGPALSVYGQTLIRDPAHRNPTQRARAETRRKER